MRNMTKTMCNFKMKQSIYLIATYRILRFPFFTGLALVGTTILFLRCVLNYIRFGAEAIEYTSKTNRTSIKAVYDRISEQCTECKTTKVITKGHCNICGAKQ